MKKIGLNAAQLKLIAIIAMVIDHILIILNYDKMTEWMLWGTIGMNMIGRLTMPIMCYFVAEGFYYTRDVKKYLGRMAIFAVISQLPFYLINIDSMPTSFYGFVKGNALHMNVICTLFMGLLALCAVKSDKLNIIFKVIICLCCVALTKYCDWKYFGVIWIIAFGIFRGSFWKQALAFGIISFVRAVRMDGLLVQLIQFSVVLALPLLYLYNGEKGKQSKYGFYIFYPAHLLIIWLIGILI